MKYKIAVALSAAVLLSSNALPSVYAQPTFTTLHSFTATSGSEGVDGFGTNSDGTWPVCGLILSGNTLYGTAVNASLGGGTVFAVNTDGSGFTNLYNFGSYSQFGLILSGNTLYGTTEGGGSLGDGMVFAVNTNGSGFPNLYSFTALVSNTNSDGANPEAGLILSGNTLYGTALIGGSSGNGTVFSLSFAPQLTIILSETNVILTWPTNVAGFDYTGYTLESTANLVTPAVWTTVSPAPVVVNGQNTVTNPISGTQQFYRLIH